MFNVDLKNTVAWVTGGNRGIGAAIAKTLAQAGCKVAITYHRNADSALAVQSEIKKAEGTCKTYKCDVAIQEECKKTAEQIIKDFGTIDVLVNSAGMIADNHFLMLSATDWSKVIDTNLLGTVHASQAVLPGMMLKRSGRIINLSSTSASKSGRGQANYAATKAAVEALTRSLAVEFASKNILVNCIAPGVIETDMSDGIIKLAKDEILKKQLIKRLGKTEDVVGWALLLASPYASFMTGQTITIDGGLNLT